MSLLLPEPLTTLSHGQQPSQHVSADVPVWGTSERSRSGRPPRPNNSLLHARLVVRSAYERRLDLRGCRTSGPRYGGQCRRCTASGRGVRPAISIFRCRPVIDLSRIAFPVAAGLWFRTRGDPVWNFGRSKGMETSPTVGVVLVDAHAVVRAGLRLLVASEPDIDV